MVKLISLLYLFYILLLSLDKTVIKKHIQIHIYKTDEFYTCKTESIVIIRSKHTQKVNRFSQAQ